MILAFKKIPFSGKGETYAQIAKMNRKCWRCAMNEVLGRWVRSSSFWRSLKALIK